jgi:hypothetical protein
MSLTSTGPASPLDIDSPFGAYSPAMPTLVILDFVVLQFAPDSHVIAGTQFAQHVHTNCTRRAVWSARLGRQRSAGFVMPLVPPHRH